MSSNLPTKRGPSILTALRTGNVSQMVQTAIEAAAGDEGNALAQLANLAIQLRRENVAVIGDHEAFIRRTEAGDLLQIIRPVRLSTADDTLWRMPKMKNGIAKITADGLLRIDEVVGSSKGVKIVVEDGPPLRVHFHVRLVAAAPDTGNPVCVEYTHTEEAEHMLFEMLGKFADSAPKACYPCTQQEATEDARKGWRFWAEYGDEGYYVDMLHPEYRAIRKKFSEVLRYTRRKGYTIALRNAMKKHPAFGGRTTFEIDANGGATIGVKGWVGQPEAVETMLGIHKRLAAGLPLPADVGIIDGNAMADETDREIIPSETPRFTAAIDRIEEEKNAADTEDQDDQERRDLIEYIDDRIAHMAPEKVAALNYNPGQNTLDDLRHMADVIEENTPSDEEN